MKKFLLVVLLMCFAVPTQAAVIPVPLGVYVAPKLTYIYNNVSYDVLARNSESTVLKDGVPTFGLGLALGYDLNPALKYPIRAELEYMLLLHNHKLALNSGAVSILGKASLYTHMLMFSAFFDFYNATFFVPYVGFGLGMNFTSGSIKNANGTRDSFAMDASLAWSLGLGVAYEMSPQIVADLGYRYTGTSAKGFEDSYSNGSSLKLRMSMHQILLGIRYMF